MFYEKNKLPELSDELFTNPTKEYRGAPFWAWNCKLDREVLRRQIKYLHDMGFGGFHMHSRTGMATPYLSDDFMSLVRFCVDEGKKNDMLPYLYDEDRWPSGAAGGLVTKNPRYRAKRIVFTDKPQEHYSFDEAVSEGKPYLLGVFDIEFDADGKMLGYKRISEKAAAENEKWYVYVKTPLNNPWFNNQTYIDTLDREAVDKFIEITYEAYKKALGDEFGKNIKSIFTDEPAFSQGFVDSDEPAVFAWTHSIPDDFYKKYGYDICDRLPELYWENSDNMPQTTRYRYHDMVAEKFASAFADNCGRWCEKNGIALTGHLVEEPMLFTQTKSIGEAMRLYRGFGIPGIDMLCNDIELTTAKQCQSAVHQFGKDAMVSELYGVTGWDFDFRGHKFQGDWQAALGVTIRVPHLSWVSMAGEAKRDYPASINYQSPWYKEYRYIENHFARVNTALTRGKPAVTVAVIHPIESMWLNYGINKNTADTRRELDETFQNIAKWLLFGSIDFDYICESTLESLAESGKVGAMQYNAVLVPGCLTLRKTTVTFLENFRKLGGKVIFAGARPKYIDGELSDGCNGLYESAQHCQLSQISILNELNPFRTVKICDETGALTDNLIYSLRKDNDCMWLFAAHAKKPETSENVLPQKITITVKGKYFAQLYDSLTGKIYPADTVHTGDKTELHFDIYQNDSLLIKLTETEQRRAEVKPNCGKLIKTLRRLGAVNYERTEPNVLLLDRAEYSLDGESFHEEEEILILDNNCRKKLGWPLRTDAFPQPWIIGERKPGHSLALRFSFESKTELTGAMLAIEDAEKLEIALNGEPVKNEISGYYVDEAIKTVRLPKILRGKNILTVSMPFGPDTNTEWCYILGEFGVSVRGSEAVITEKTDKIGFSDITAQGLPFYGGNLRYSYEINVSECAAVMQLSYYRGAMVKVYVDGEEKDIIAFAPYRLELGHLSEGRHKIVLELFGNRANTFGGLHNIRMPRWIGPTYWRSEGAEWGYEYNFKQTGILTSPIISLYGKE